MMQRDIISSAGGGGTIRLLPRGMRLEVYNQLCFGIPSVLLRVFSIVKDTLRTVERNFQ